MDKLPIGSRISIYPNFIQFTDKDGWLLVVARGRGPFHPSSHIIFGFVREGQTERECF